MGFQDVMKQMFLRIAAGDVEPEEWEQWWNSNRLCTPEELPTRFVSTALAAFRAIIGNSKKE